jgi:hypothetical protein
MYVKLNACEDEWLVGMGVLQEEKEKNKSNPKNNCQEVI